MIYPHVCIMSGNTLVLDLRVVESGVDGSLTADAFPPDIMHPRSRARVSCTHSCVFFRLGFVCIDHLEPRHVHVQAPSLAISATRNRPLYI